MKIKHLLAMIAALAMLSPQRVWSQVPRPEYPRPQFERADWRNLNGTWTYTFDFGRSGDQRGYQNSTGFDGQITVPFCPESKLSGIGYTDFITSMWYQRRIDIPQEWQGKKILLNFGAVDYEAYIYIDGRKIFAHQGTGSSFSCDLTRFVEAGKSHNLVVRVLDDLRSGNQPGGKQNQAYLSAGCHYTRTTGIWQTVWMEAVDKEGLKSVYAVPDIDQQVLMVTPEFYGENMNNTLTVTVSDGKKTVVEKTVKCSSGSVIVLPIKNAHLWSPEDPFLYDITYKVQSKGKTIDKVKSYAGMRKVHCQDGYFYLNNKPYYQRLVLDQGFYPDGIWTAPSDEALKNDIQLSMAAGFNGARLHQKNFEERFFYWADKLGYLTWEEFPSWGLDLNRELPCKTMLSEWTSIVIRDRNHPSIVTWTPLNETWGVNDSGVFERFVRDLYATTKGLDLSRPVHDASGDSHIVTDIWGVHHYGRAAVLEKDLKFEHGKEPYRSVPDQQWLAKYEGQPYMVDEFGGLAWIRPSDRVANSWGYGDEIKSMEDFYSTLKAEIDALKNNPHVVGFCYTQLTDVEQEQNGIYYYDRTSKFDMNRIRAIFESIPAQIEPQDLSY